VKHTILALFFLTLCLNAKSVGPKHGENQGPPTVFEVKAKILRTLRAHLPKNHVGASRAIASAIYYHSTTKKLDPMIITAVISGESGFNPSAVGPVGEIGMMQLRPATGEWIARRMNIPWKGARALAQPIYNIHLGTAYLSYLKQKFSSRGGQLYLAAYNMGEANVEKFLTKNIQPKIYSQHVQKNFVVINAY
jgi:soluble lytic murein transglycosylase-like protein